VTYRLVTALARLLLRVFYRRIDIVGLEHVPPRGPLIVVANHHNALVDPMLLLAAVPRRLVPISKAPLFRHPLIGPFLRLIGAIPVHRRQESGPDVARNEATFARAIAALQGGGAIMIFPEGVSQSEPALMPLRTGAARMLLGADAGSDGGLAVTLLPAGLLFENPSTFRGGRALVLIGAPVTTRDVVRESAGDPDAAIRRLTDRTADVLKRLIVEAQDRETLRLLQLANTLWREASGDRSADAGSRTAWMQSVLRARDYLAARERERVDRFRRELEQYRDDLELAGLRGSELADRYPPSAVVRYALREGGPLLLGLPLALCGIALHLVPYQLTRLAVRVARPEPDTEATYKLGAAVLLYPLCWIGEGWLVWRLAGVWPLAVFGAALIPTAFFALAWQERVDRFRRHARGFVDFLVAPDLHRRLLTRRKALIEELSALARLVPEAVLSARSRD
jgi:1-acyl-sn-glycerol-3-phosphate acyltransferase